MQQSRRKQTYKDIVEQVCVHSMFKSVEMNAVWKLLHT